MHHRPKLSEALTTLKQLAAFNADAKAAVQEYETIKKSGDEFLAARFVVEIVDLFNHLQKIETVNG